MPKPIANAKPFTGDLIGEYLVALQAGIATDGPGLDQMTKLKLSVLRDYIIAGVAPALHPVHQSGSTLPENPANGDYFFADTTFTVSGKTYTQGHMYTWDGTEWEDTSNIFSQYASQAQVDDIQLDVDDLERKVEALDGLDFKGDITEAELEEITPSAENKGWLYYVTDLNVYMASDGTDWVPVMEYITQTIAAGDTTHAPSADAVNQALEEKANKDGSYATLTAGNAEQLLSSALIHDQAIYTNRTAGGGGDIGNKSYLKKIVGVTIPWNQIAINKSATITPDGSETYSTNSVKSSNVSQNGHIFYVSIDIQYSGSKTLRAYLVEQNASPANYGKVVSPYDISIGKSHCEWLIKTNTDSSLTVGLSNIQTSDKLTSADEWSRDNTMVFDITQIYGSSIANVIWGMSASDAFQWLHRYIIYGKYYPFTANPTLQSVCVSSKENTGFNQWDEEWELGKYNITTGEKEVTAGRIRNKNLIPVLPNTTYYFKCPNNLEILWYDANGNFISYVGDSANTTYTSPANAYYCNFCVYSAYGTTYKNDICISIHWDDSRDGEYEPFKKYSYPMDSSVELRGFPKLDANNELYYDGDEYNADGSVTRKMETIVYDGSDDENWFVSFGGRFYIKLDELPKRQSYLGYMLSDKLTVVSTFVDMPDLSVSGYQDNTTPTYPNENWLYVKINSSVTTVAQLKTWLEQNPISIIYKLATPETESATPFTEEQVCDNWGTEAFTDGLTRDVFVPPMAVADYTQNLRDKLEASPSTPDADGLYLMKRENGQNSYIQYVSPIPTESTDGTYVLKATVTDGEMTLAWVPEGA